MTILENVVGISKEAQLKQSRLSHAATMLDTHQIASAIGSRRTPGIMISLAGARKSFGVRAYFGSACGPWAESFPMKGDTERPDLSIAEYCIVGKERVGVMDGRGGDWRYLVEIGGL